MGSCIYNVLLKSTLSLLTTCWHMKAKHCTGLNKVYAVMICRSVLLFLFRINLFILRTCSSNCMQNSYIDHVHHDHIYHTSIKKTYVHTEHNIPQLDEAFCNHWVYAVRSENVWWCWIGAPPNYRVIHKSLPDFRTRLRNNQDRHGRKEHINRLRISPSFFLY